jgi:hypothetical protein
MCRNLLFFALILEKSCYTCSRLKIPDGRQTFAGFFHPFLPHKKKAAEDIIQSDQ